jgi:tetratricopeptide (TPR) repeat protein
LDGSDLRRRMRALLVGGAPPRAEVVAGLVGIGSPWPAPWQLAHGGTWQALLELRRETDPRTETVLTVALLAGAFAEVGDAAEAERVLRQAVTARPQEVVLLVALGRLLERQGPTRCTEVIGYYRAARGPRPLLGIALGRVLLAAGKADEAEEVLQELVRQPEHDRDPVLFCNLGATLFSRRKYIEAEAASRKATDLQPDFAKAHVNLGNALIGQGRHQEAEQACHDAIRLKPDFAEAQISLGLALIGQGRHQEAERACRDAIRLKPDLAEAHSGLGVALNGQGRHKEAERAYRDAIKLKPELAEAHFYLGVALIGQGRHQEAERACRDAIRLKPELAEAHINLGNALNGQCRHKEAEQAFGDAIRLKPDLAEAHYNLGMALGPQGRHKESEQAFRDAIRLKPDYAEAQCNLGCALRRQGEFREALEALRRGDQLGSKDPRWPYPSAEYVRRCEHLVDLDEQLPGFLAGKTEPASPAERIELAELCYCKRLNRAAGRFYEEAFTAQPGLAEDPRGGHRYDAACAVALAGCGQGKDAADLDDAERARWRRQALEWLRLDLAWWGKALDGGKAQSRALVGSKMQHWRSDGDFAGVCGNDALARIPAEERKEWESFWAEVDALIRRASEPD